MLDPDLLQVWRIDLTSLQVELDVLAATLSSEERSRANRFHFVHHRRRFTVAHAALRMILARYLDCQPADIRFRLGDRGKPVLDQGFPRLHFNLSHSADGALLGLSSRHELGIDLERIRPMTDATALARRFFAAGEIADLLQLPPCEQSLAFFRCWTRKEAYIKAIGEGLACPLDRFRVSLRPEAPVRILEIGDDIGEGERWSLHELAPWEGYIGCAAVRFHGLHVECADFHSAQLSPVFQAAPAPGASTR